jgi:hypothetical protein
MPADFKQSLNLAGKILASSRVAAASTDTTIYTVPAATATKIATAVLCNTGSTAARISVSVVPASGTVDGTHLVVSSYSLPAGDSMTVQELISAFLNAGAFISLNVSLAATVTYLLTGVESS